MKPDQWARLIKQRVEEYDCIRKGWILEGFPETREQAISLLSIGVIPKHTGMSDRHLKNISETAD